jgi:predicted dehydrogenase
MIRPARRRIRYAVVGLGYIAQIAALPAFAHARENSELAALVSDDPKKLAALAKRYHVEDTYAYEEFDDCLASGIDAVYLALPNSLHAGFAIRAAEAGVHVLTEKPMAVDVRQCERMIAAAEANRVKLMVAYRLHFERANLAALELARSGRIGAPRFFASTFSMQVAEGNSRLRWDLGGGSLFDLGIYCINAARTLFAAEPISAYAVATHQGARFREVDEMTSAVLTFPGERTAVFTSSFGAATTSAYDLVGTKGCIRVDPAYEESGELRLRLTVGGRASERRFPDRDQFAPEFVYFSRCILEDRQPEPSGHEGLADLRVIEALRRSVATGRAIALEPATLKRPVSPRQEIHRRPVRAKPALIDAQDPSRDES